MTYKVVLSYQGQTHTALLKLHKQAIHHYLYLLLDALASLALGMSLLVSESMGHHFWQPFCWGTVSLKQIDS